MYSSDEATQMCPQRFASPTSKYPLRDTGDNITHMVFEGEPAVKLYAKNVKVGTSANGKARQDQVTMERVDRPGYSQPVAGVLAYLHVQVSPISY